MGVMSKILDFCALAYAYPMVMGAACVMGSLFGILAVDLGVKPDSGPVIELRAMTNMNKMCRACIYLRRVCPRGDLECSYAILRWIVRFLNSAQTSIDAAIYLMTCSEFKEAFINAHNRGVKIRFISDATMSEGTGSAIPHLRAAGIVVRTADFVARHMMHRKSVIVDNEWILSGTGNWTMQSMCGNWDGFVKTNDPMSVQSLLKAFELEWAVYNPNPELDPPLEAE